MAKPPTLPEWSSDANYPADAAPEAGTPTTLNPSAGQKQTGWRPGAKAPAQVFNWWQNLVWLWIKWFFDDTHVRPIPALDWDPDGATSEYIDGRREIPNGSPLRVPVRLDTGATLVSASARVDGLAGTATITLTLYEYDNDTDDLVAIDDADYTGADWGDLTLTVNQEMRAGCSYWLELESDEANNRVGNTLVAHKR